jgi:2-methylcitrate dehydratase PrpD
MTVARDLAEFLTGTSSADLPPQAVEHAAMLIASTLASAAMGAGLESSAIIRDLARERGGTREASVAPNPSPGCKTTRRAAAALRPRERRHRDRPHLIALSWAPQCRSGCHFL